MFNERYAQQVYDDLMARDPEEAEMLSLFTVYDVIHDDIAGNRRTLESSRQAILKSMRQDLAPILTERADDESLIAAALLSVVSKSDWQEDLHPRAHNGRFRRKMDRAAGVERRTLKQTGQDGKEYIRHEYRVHQPGQLSYEGAFHRNVDEFSRRIDQARQEDSPAGRVYQRMEAGGKVLGVVGRATGNPGLTAAGHTAQFAGMYGPQAERVVGDSMRRNTYRFRGTERKVDSSMQKDQTAILADFTRSDAQEFKPSVKAPDRAKFVEGGKFNREAYDEALQGYRQKIHSERAAHLGAQANGTPEMRAEAGRQAAINYLTKRLPKKELSQLHEESGRIPPSEGVIIDANGDITTQSVGYMEDHYLPFNLKNLKALRGGQYVRTRSTGGPTSEDISAATLAGARSLTVVSRSGVFTIDLEDDLKGGRRYNDKVKQMTGQYQNALSAVASGKVKRRGISAAEKADIRQDVEDEMGGFYSPGEREAEYNRRIAEYSVRPQLTDAEAKDIDARARKDAAEMAGGMAARHDGRRMPADANQRYRILRNEYTEAALNEKQATNHRLDGQGYDAAMKSLREQFPYYIQDTDWQPLSDPERGRNPVTEVDRAHVKRGQLHPFRQSNTVRPHSRNTENSSESNSGNTASAEQTTQEEKKGSFKPLSPEDAKKKFDLARSQSKAGAEALKDGLTALKSVGVDDEQLKKQMAASPAAAKLFQDGNADNLSSQERKEAADHLKVMAQVFRDTAKNPDQAVYKERLETAAKHLDKAVENFKNRASVVGSGVTDLKRDATEYSTPLSFKGPMFEKGHEASQYAKQFALRAKRMGGMSENPAEVNDDTLKAMSQYHALRAQSAERRAKDPNYDPNEEFASLGEAAERTGNPKAFREAGKVVEELASMSPEEAQQHAENAWNDREIVEQARSLKQLFHDHGGHNPAGGQLKALTGQTQAAPEAKATHQIEPVRTRNDLASMLDHAQRGAMSRGYEEDADTLAEVMHYVKRGRMADAREVLDQVDDEGLRNYSWKLMDSYQDHGEDLDD